MKDMDISTLNVITSESRADKAISSLKGLLLGINLDGEVNQIELNIVGDNGNPAWAFSCYGRKVEKAIDMRKGGHNNAYS